jgi:acetyl esterase/lipase
MATKTLIFERHGAEALHADVYLPEASAATPAVIAIHGGGWKGGTRKAYQYLGPLLAGRGYALLAIDYRLVEREQNRYPAALDDVRGALRYVREHAGELNVDPARIVLLGDSAGGHLAALAGLTERPQVKAVVGVFGVYDLVAQWQHDLLSRPHDNISSAFLGVSPAENRQLYFDASPMSYAIGANNGPAFLLAWGTHDDIVDPVQSEAFLLALKQAGFYARPIIQAAGHYWISDPLDEPGSHSAYFAARLLRFLDDRLGMA